jgi:hypothetical protein
LKTIKDEDIKRFIQVQFKEKLEAINFGDWVALALEPLQKGNVKDQLLTNLLEVMSVELSNNKDLIRKKVKAINTFFKFRLWPIKAFQKEFLMDCKSFWMKQKNRKVKLELK